jgi:hypothetical protein
MDMYVSLPTLPTLPTLPLCLIVDGGGVHTCRCSCVCRPVAARVVQRNYFPAELLAHQLADAVAEVSLSLSLLASDPSIQHPLFLSLCVGS